MIQTLVTQLLTAAASARASDIYILPNEHGYQVRWRTAQTITPWRQVTATTGQQLLTYFKFHGNMAVSEQRRPQVGAMNWSLEGTSLALRLSAVGDFAGQESLVIRLIYPYQQLAHEYLFAAQLTQLAELSAQRGLLLFSGPTGSGKTTTMYTVARQLGSEAVILTIEDPVEIHESRFLQLQVNPEATLTYESLIKVGLRHRPDVFIIGEIRDAITAQAAVRAALSGHLVLSTLHARSAAGTIARLRDLGIARDQLKQVLTATSYQRLIPRSTGELAVLMDLVSGTTLWQSPTDPHERWHRQLDLALAQHQITTATRQRFWQG